MWNSVGSQHDTPGFCRGAIIFSVFFILAGCASAPNGAAGQWAAHGYLTPGPTSDPEIIGVYDSESDCDDAAEAWMSRQVVGNPIFAECYPVDSN